MAKVYVLRCYDERIIFKPDILPFSCTEYGKGYSGLNSNVRLPFYL